MSSNLSKFSAAQRATSAPKKKLPRLTTLAMPSSGLNKFGAHSTLKKKISRSTATAMSPNDPKVPSVSGGDIVQAVPVENFGISRVASDISIETARYEYAESYFFGFLATTKLFDLEQRSGVLFVGLPRAGKSSAVAVQRGTTLFQGDNTDGSSSYNPQYRKGDPKISHSTVAKTVNVTMFRDWRNMRNIIDTAGLNDNRSEAYKVWSNFSLETAFALTENVSATCVVVHYTTSFAPGANADSFRDLAQTLLASAGTEDQKQDFLDNLCFLLTHVGPTATKAGVIQRLKEVHLSYLQEQVYILENFARRYPLESRNLVLDAAHKGIRALTVVLSTNPHVQELRGRIDKLRGRIDFDNKELAADPLLSTWERIVASILLLETMISSKHRIVLSRPDGAWRCQAQRDSLEKAFRLCKPLNRNKLRSLAACRSLPSYEVYGILEHVARQMRIKLDDFNTAMATFLDSVEKQDEVIKSIKDNWCAYRDKCKADFVAKRRAIQRKVEGKEKEIARMKESKDLKAPPGNIRNATKFKNSWMAWMGLEFTRDTVTHKGPYADIKVEGEYGTKEIIDDKAKNSVSVVLRSKWLGNIDAKVHFLRHECDLEETKERIKEQRKAIQRLEQEIQQIDNTLRSLASATSAESLTNILVSKKMKREITDLQRERYEVTKLVSTSIFDDDSEIKSVAMTVPYCSACEGLNNLVLALIKENAIPEVIRQTGWMTTIGDFTSSYGRRKELLMKYERNVSATMLVSASESHFVQGEHQSPSNPDIYEGNDTKIERCLQTFTTVLHTCWSTVHPMIENLIREHPRITLVALGFAFLSIGMKSHPCTSLAVFMIALGLLMLVSHTLFEIRRFVRTEIDYIRGEIEHRLDGLEDLARDGGTEVSRQVNELRRELLGMLDARLRRTDQRLNMQCLAVTAFKIIVGFFGLGL